MEQFAKDKYLKIWYQTFGDKKNPALLLIAGGCCQAVMWDESFCKKLVNAGFYVIRYDHRDSGLSTPFDFDKRPYDLLDMTNDAILILNSENIEKAHLFGFSMGALIAECAAAYFSERIATITLLGSSPDIHPMNLAYADLPADQNNKLSSPTNEYLAWMKEWRLLQPSTKKEMLTQRLEGWNTLNGKKIPLDESSNIKMHQQFLNRFHYPQGIRNHILMLASEKSEQLVREVPYKIKIPTTILQGSEDPIFPPDHGETLAQMIHGSNYLLVEGMGHIPNDKFFEFYINILKNKLILFNKCFKKL